MEKTIEWLVENWAILVGVLAIMYFIYNSLKKFIKLPKIAKSEQIRVWVLYAITQAEKEFGGGHGEIKLGKVYGDFVRTFPSLAKIITFETFKTIVDESLKSMRVQLEAEKINEKLKAEVKFRAGQELEMKQEGKL